MITKIKSIISLFILAIVLLPSCVKDGEPGPAGQDGLDTEIYYSEWFSPTEWSGEAGDWYFIVPAPDLTENVVEGGVILAYAWLEGDLYEGATVRPLPAYAVGANWSYLLFEYGSIEFTCDMISMPATEGNSFRFIAIPGNISALKSVNSNNFEKLKRMPYSEVCSMFNIPE